ncbi:MAG: DUF1947 domain-containing protein [Promethearchaeota archaeon]
MDIKQRHYISKSEIKKLKEEILNQYDKDFLNAIFPKKAKIEMILTEAGDILYAVNGELVLWKSQEGYIPVLTLLLENRVKLKSIVVDMGAVRFVTLNRADIMRPGIVEIDPSIKKGDIVQIQDERNRRVLAVGKALYDAGEMEQMSSGKVVKNLHSISKDDVWNFAKEFQ